MKLFAKKQFGITVKFCQPVAIGGTSVPNWHAKFEVLNKADAREYGFAVVNRGYAIETESGETIIIPAMGIDTVSIRELK